MTDNYDRIYGQLHELALMSRPSTIVQALPIAGNQVTWIVQTAMHDTGPVVFLQSVSAEGDLRIVVPARVVRTIIAQEARLRERMNDRRSETRKRADADRNKVVAARKVLEAKRAERAKRKAAQ